MFLDSTIDRMGTRASLLAAGILIVMIPFLLLSRQCRYYSMAFFFDGLYLDIFFVPAVKKVPRLLLVCCTVILFHVQLIYGAIFIVTIMIHLTLTKKRIFQTYIGTRYRRHVLRSAMDNLYF